MIDNNTESPLAKVQLSDEYKRTKSDRHLVVRNVLTHKDTRESRSVFLFSRSLAGGWDCCAKNIYA